MEATDLFSIRQTSPYPAAGRYIQHDLLYVVILSSFWDSVAGKRNIFRLKLFSISINFLLQLLPLLLFHQKDLFVLSLNGKRFRFLDFNIFTLHLEYFPISETEEESEADWHSSFDQVPSSSLGYYWYSSKYNKFRNLIQWRDKNIKKRREKMIIFFLIIPLLLLSSFGMKIRKRGEGFKEDEKIGTAKMKQSQWASGT